MRYLVAIVLVAAAAFGLLELSGAGLAHATQVRDSGAPVPLGSQLYIAFSHFVSRWFVLLVAALLVVAVAAAHVLGRRGEAEASD